MTKRGTPFVLAIISMLLVLLGAAGNLCASPLLISSPQKRSTAGRFAGAADDFISPRGYSSLNLDRWFGVFSFMEDRATGPRTDFNNTEMAQLGFAARFGGLYAAAYYGGNAWKALGETSSGNIYNFTEQQVNFFSANRSMRVYDSEPLLETARDYRIYNEAALLIGFLDMGFRLAYVTNYQTFKLNEDFGVNAGAGTMDFYKNYRTDFGRINPEIAWGMARDLIPDLGIKPELKVDLNFVQNYLQTERYVSSGVTNGKRVVRSENYLDLGISAALGGFTLYKADTLKLSADLEYTVRLLMYDNEYSYLNASGNYETGRFKGQSRNNGNLEDDRENAHTLIPSLSVSWAGDRLVLASRLGLDMLITGRYDSTLKLKTGSYDGTLLKDGPEDKTSAFKFNPVLELGMRWEIVSGKLFLNAGGVLGLGGLSFTKIQRKAYIQDIEDASRASTDINNSFSSASTGLRLGVTLNPTTNLGFHVLCGINTGANAINVFDITRSGLLSFANVLATVQF